MKKYLLGLCFIMLAGLAYASPKFVPVQIAPATDQQVTTTPTVLTDLSIYYVGVTAGNKIEFKNGTQSGTTFYTYVAPAAAGTAQWVPEKALLLDQGLYIDQTVTAGTFGVNVFYQ